MASKDTASTTRNVKDQLPKAKELFFGMNVLETYQILRRFYDRIPFKFEPEHADYITLFSRVLVELGKVHEFQFYVQALEKHYRESPTPEVQFTLAVVYFYLYPDKKQKSVELLEAVLRNKSAESLHTRCKLFMAAYYDEKQENKVHVKTLLDSISVPNQTNFEIFLKVWKAKHLIEEGKDKEAKKTLDVIFSDENAKNNWYPYLLSRILLARVYLKQKRVEDAGAILEDLRKEFSESKLRTLKDSLVELEKLSQEVKKSKKTKSNA